MERQGKAVTVRSKAFWSWLKSSNEHRSDSLTGHASKPPLWEFPGPVSLTRLVLPTDALERNHEARSPTGAVILPFFGKTNVFDERAKFHTD